jgi:hypothetical protein
MRPRIPLDALLLEELEVGLVDQPDGVEGVAGPLQAQAAAGDRPELVVDQRHELVEGAPVPIAERKQELRRVVLRRHGRNSGPDEGERQV